MISVNLELLFDTLSNVAKNVYIFETVMAINYFEWLENVVSYFDLQEDYHTSTLNEWEVRIYPEDS